MSTLRVLFYLLILFLFILWQTLSVVYPIITQLCLQLILPYVQNSAVGHCSPRSPVLQGRQSFFPAPGASDLFRQQACAPILPNRTGGSVREECWGEFSPSWKGTHHRASACVCLQKNGSLYFIYSFNKYLLPSSVLKSKVYLFLNRKGMALALR